MSISVISPTVMRTSFAFLIHVGFFRLADADEDPHAARKQNFTDSIESDIYHHCERRRCVVCHEAALPVIA